MKKITPLLLVLLLSFFAISCDPKDDDTAPAAGGETNTNFPEHFGPAVQRDFIGQVVDMNDLPISAATVKIGNTSVQTDVNGVFIVNHADVHERFAYVTAVKAGFVDGSRSLVPTSGKNNIKIMLIPMLTTATVSAGAASEVALPNGTKVKFDGAFIDANGNAYSGDVSVSMFHLKSSDANIGALMPGMLYAQGEDGGEKILQTFGMLHVELRGGGGQELQIATNHTAEISMLIDDTQMATAPSEIPLWHFDEAGGYWKQDGSAIKTGNKYVGAVSHFSWWNCDATFPTVHLAMVLTGQSGQPLSNVTVQISALSPNVMTNSRTDGSGQISGLVPSNAMLTVSVYNGCGFNIYTSQINPLTADTVLPTLTISDILPVMTVVNGNLTNCDGENVTNGYLMLHYGSYNTFATVTEGAFSLSVPSCAEGFDFTIKGFDLGSLQATGEITYHSTATVTNLGNIPACTAISEYISFQVNNDPVDVITEAIDSDYQDANTFSIRGNQWNFTLPGFTLLGAYSSAGTYGLPQTGVTVRHNPGSGMTSYTVNSSSGASSSCVVKVNKFGGVGDYVDFTFSATKPDITPLTITGNGHVKRNN